MTADQRKFNTVVEKNTFYFYNPIFEHEYEGHINSLGETLLVLRNEIEEHGLKREIFEDLLLKKQNGLTALTTTSSGQGDKSKTEVAVNKLLKQYYPQSKFIGFVDGIGWYVRQADLKRMVSAYDDVFTFEKSEIKRFISLLEGIMLYG